MDIFIILLYAAAMLLPAQHLARATFTTLEERNEWGVLGITICAGLYLTYMAGWWSLVSNVFRLAVGEELFREWFGSFWIALFF